MRNVRAIPEYIPAKELKNFKLAQYELYPDLEEGGEEGGYYTRRSGNESYWGLDYHEPLDCFCLMVLDYDMLSPGQQRNFELFRINAQKQLKYPIIVSMIESLEEDARYLGIDTGFIRGYARTLMSDPNFSTLKFSPKEKPSDRLCKLMLYASLIEAIIRIGHVENTDDWNPYLRIKTDDGHSIETPIGFTSIEYVSEGKLAPIREYDGPESMIPKDFSLKMVIEEQYLDKKLPRAYLSIELIKIVEIKLHAC